MGDWNCWGDCREGDPVECGTDTVRVGFERDSGGDWCSAIVELLRLVFLPRFPGLPYGS